MLPTSSATSSAPPVSGAIPTGRPCARPRASRKRVSTSNGGRVGQPPAKDQAQRGAGLADAALGLIAR